MASSSTCVEDPRVPRTGSPSFSKCDKCNPEQHKNTKNIIVCIDGTSNKFGRNNTNVVKLLAKIDQLEQRTYYSSGIGTRPKALEILKHIKNVFVDSIDLAIAWNVGEIIKEAYRWLVQTYKDGDQIYFFGFSRGAYQVRVLAEMIHEVGLIKEVTEKQIGVAYDHYQGIRSGNLEARPIAKDFKETFSWQDARVHFVGVWDTVSSVGLLKKDVFLSTSSSAAHACHFRHALALDERRVKFIPEYLCEINSRVYGKSEGVANATKTCNVKEVWFAGCHSDVGGKSRPGRPYHAGNIPLLWMRREAAAQGLVLKPTDVSWSPEDVDFGTSNSMNLVWRLVEYLPTRYQGCFSGAGENAVGLHRLRPRRIIPGQKVHASILYASAYNPKATQGEGFDIPITELDNPIWETGLFDDTAAKELVTYLGSQQTTPMNLYRLLFMLRFEEGKQCIRSINGQDEFKKLVEDPNCEPLVRLVAVVAYHEVSCEPKECSQVAPLTTDILQLVFNNAKQRISNMLPEPAFYDALTVTALLQPLAKHQVLQGHMFTNDVEGENVIKVFFWFYDMVFLHPDWDIVQRREAFGQVVDSMNSLLQREDKRETLFAELQKHPSVPLLSQILKINRERDTTLGGCVLSALAETLGSSLPHDCVSRLGLIVYSSDHQLLIAALRMVLTVARIPAGRNDQPITARKLCSPLKQRIEKLTAKDDPLVGVLAVEILLALYPRPDDWHVKIKKKKVRANFARALARVHLKSPTSANGISCSGGDPGRQLLRSLFGLGETRLNQPQQNLIGELKNVVETGKVRERTDATMILLKLCDTESIRTHLRDIGLLYVLIVQLQYKDSALLAAYALATCLNYSEMTRSIKEDKDFAKRIVGMLKLDYFDDAIGQVEGFRIFADLIKDAELREKMKKCNIIEILTTKLGTGKRKQIRTSLICLNTFQSFDPEGTWTDELAAKSMDHLKHPIWKVQKVGLTILFALSQTERGVEAIKIRIPEIIERILPSSVQPAGSRSTTTSSAQQSSQPRSPPSSDTSSRLPSRMMGPACALRIFAQNVTLREYMCGTKEYGRLKHLHLSGVLVDQTDTPFWHIFTPNRADLMTTLDQMVTTVDGRVPDGPMSLGDAVLPDIWHWERLAKEVSMRAGMEIYSLVKLLGILVAGILVVVTFCVVKVIRLLYLLCTFIMW